MRRAAIAVFLLSVFAPGVVPAQVPPPAPVQSQPLPAPSGQTGPSTPAPPAPAPEAWLPRQTADLILLDKVTARTTQVSAHVGQAITFGSLSITVKSCVVRPPDQPADAAAWLDITDSRPGPPPFHGWMLVSAPQVSMLEHPVYDVRLAGCRA